MTATADVTVQVLNVDEPGAVALSTNEPGAGETITAVLTDPDGGIDQRQVVLGTLRRRRLERHRRYVGSVLHHHD